MHVCPSAAALPTGETGERQHQPLESDRGCMCPRTRRSRALRSAASFPERLLWSRIRRRQLGVRFRRQFPIGPYYVDFASIEARLVIEVDGSLHDLVYDARRDTAIEGRGYRVLRLSSVHVCNDLDGVVQTIRGELALGR